MTSELKDEKKAPPEITIRESWCKGCGFCVEFCPKDVLAMAGPLPVVAADPETCTRCLLCVFVCPDFAIQVK
jgi:2-oxoglutarate ferredoxin oxidoreductase subunit delta